jgi:signal peptidase I
MRWTNALGRMKLLGCSGLVACLLACCWASSAQAQSPPQACNPAIYTASTSIGGKTFDVYARMARPGERANVNIDAQTVDAPCTNIGSAQVTGDQWGYVGVWVAPAAPGGLTQFNFNTAQSQGLLEANRPMVMLVSRSSPACKPSDECRVTVQGQQGVVRPASRASLGETLRLTEVHDPSTDQLQEVGYYIDDKPAYSKPQLEPFNMHYVGPGEHTLLRVLRYASGQQVVMTQTVDRGYGDALLDYLFFSFIYGRKTVLRLVGGVIFVVIFWWVTLLIVHALYRRHLWRVTHFVKRSVRPNWSPAPMPEPLHLTKPHPVIGFLKYMLPVALIVGAATCVAMLSDKYIVQIYQIDGQSMQDTLQSGNLVMVKKWDVTWAKLDGKPFIPRRGDVVVLSTEAGAASFGQSDELVKRVIGLPGDRVTLAGDKITIYNTQHPEGFDPDANSPWSAAMRASGGGLIPGNPQFVDVTVGPGQVFVCGDNRAQSTDSRTFGPVDAETLAGQAVVRLLPPGLIR